MPNEQNKNKEIEDLKNYIKTAESSLASAKKTLSDLTGQPVEPLVIPNFNTTPASDKIIEGAFDGENMVGPGGKIYPVPANYASKSKLIIGDKLKLSVAEDGSFIFKQIGPAERRKIIGTLAFENNAYHVMAEGKVYKVLYASVTYYKAQDGDRVTLVVPGQGEADWAALDNVIHEVPEKEEFEENILTDTDSGNDFWATVDAPAENAPVTPVATVIAPETAPIPAPEAVPAAVDPLSSPAVEVPAEPKNAAEMDI